MICDIPVSFLSGSSRSDLLVVNGYIYCNVKLYSNSIYSQGCANASLDVNLIFGSTSNSPVMNSCASSDKLCQVGEVLS